MRTIGILLLLMALVLFALSFRTKAAEPPDILKGARQVAIGQCLFKENKFQAFVQNVMAPKGTFTITHCILFAKDPEMNPSWLVLVDESLTIQKIIRWSNPATFETVYQSLEGSI